MRAGPKGTGTGAEIEGPSFGADAGVETGAGGAEIRIIELNEHTGPRNQRDLEELLFSAVFGERPEGTRVVRQSGWALQLKVEGDIGRAVPVKHCF
jgi:hypothetical protein